MNKFNVYRYRARSLLETKPYFKNPVFFHKFVILLLFLRWIKIPQCFEFLNIICLIDCFKSVDTTMYVHLQCSMITTKNTDDEIKIWLRIKENYRIKNTP